VDSFWVFQGGGAAGLVHVGALRALRDLEIRPVGVAGASAGAIVAAMVAAGYAPEELVFEPGKTPTAAAGDLRLPDPVRWNIFRAHGTSPVALIGRFNWAMLQLPPIAWAALFLLFLLALGGLAAALLGVRPPAALLAAGAGLAALVLAWAITWQVHLAGGDPSPAPAPLGLLTGLAWADSMDARVFLEARLRDGVMRLARRRAARGVPGAEAACARLEARLVRARRPVRFRDLQDAGGLLLKIAVTNLATGTQTIFGMEETPDAAVADAVIASMSIPLAFPPCRIRREPAAGEAAPPRWHPADRFVDGGLVGNLPLWVFSAERRALERQRADGAPVPIIGFAIEAKGGSRRADRFSLPAYLARVARTGIFGSQRQLLDRVAGSLVVPLRTAIGTLDFALPRKTAEAAIAEAQAEARARLLWRLVGQRAGAEAGLRLLLAFVRARWPAEATPPALLRACLYRLSLRGETQGEFEAVASLGREGHADRLMSLEPASPLAAPRASLALNLQTGLRGRTAADLCLRVDERARIPEAVDQSLAVPIVADPALGSPPGLVLIDSDGALQFLLPHAAELLAAAAELRYVLLDRPPATGG